MKTFFSLLFGLSILGQISGQSVDNNQLREMVSTTIESYFAEWDTLTEIRYFLPEVKDLGDSVLFSLRQTDLDSNHFQMVTEKSLKKKDIPFPVYLQHIEIAQKKDTVNIEIEEYQIAFRNYLLFKTPIRYWVCKSGFPHFVDGQFIFKPEDQKWKFDSGIQKLEDWKNRPF
jgi:hypothetical protein